MLFGSPCRRHWAALVDFADRRELGPATAAALDHVARCARCERELSDLALTAIALRRLGRSVATQEPRRDLPLPALVAAQRPARRWTFRGSLMGASQLSALLVAAIVLLVGPQAATVVPVDGVAAPATTTAVDRGYDPAPPMGVVPAQVAHGAARPAAQARRVPVAEDRVNAVPPRPATGGQPAPAAIPVGGIRS